jgi:hypothetical protein
MGRDQLQCQGRREPMDQPHCEEFGDEICCVGFWLSQPGRHFMLNVIRKVAREGVQLQAVIPDTSFEVCE